MLRFSIVISLLCTLLISSCKEEVPFENNTYMCECGSNTWKGTTYELTDAHWITIATEVDSLGIERITGKEYYTTAKIEIEGELEPHHVNMRLAIGDISQGTAISLDGTRFFSLGDEDITSVSIQIEDVNFNELSIVDEHAVIAGVFTYIPGISGTDQIDFQLEIVRLFEGSAAGLPFVYSGTLIASQEGV